MRLSVFASPLLLRVVIRRALWFAALWWILAEGEPRGAWLGALAVATAVGASLVAWRPGRGGLSPGGLAAFVIFFLRESLLSGLAVAGLALRPRLRLRPCMRLLPLRLPPGIGRVLLAGTLTLLPGTLSVGFEGDSLRLHVLDGALFAEADLRAAEDRIAHLLGMV